MRVFLASTSYPISSEDWRGRFIADMAGALSGREEIQLSVWTPPGPLPQDARYVVSDSDAAWLMHLMQQGGIAHLLRKRLVFALPTVWSLLRRLRRAYRESDADILHINWLQNALPGGCANKPMLITVLGSDLGLLRLPGMVSLLRMALRNRRILLAPNAAWMEDTLQRHFGDLAEIRTIPFGIAAEWFALRRQYIANQPEWLAVTRLTTGKLGDLFAWGATVFGTQRTLHLFGPRQDPDIEIPPWVRYHGPTHPAELRDIWFPRAAGLITLSRHDEGRPQVMLEAMAAGLPIVASDLPAHRDLIRHDLTGLLVDRQEALLDAITRVEQPLENRRLGEAAQTWTREEIGTWADCAERYLDAYQHLLAPAHA